VRHCDNGVHQRAPRVLSTVEKVMTLSKPTVQQLGIDVDDETWQRSTDGPDAIEVAFVRALGERWVLTRVAGAPHGRILVYNLLEWECFLDGAKAGEFDDAV
jgi:hypothetical protein